MSYISINDLAESTSFLTRVKVAIVRVAAIVIHEDVSALSVARAAKRNALARSILLDPAPNARMFVWAVVANPVIAGTGLDTSDGDIEYQVGQTFDAMAGVTAAEL